MPERGPLRVLLLSDPTLGPAALQRAQAAFPGVDPVIWRRGDRAGREAARRTLLGGGWDLALSVYNDLVLRPEELARIAVPLNIHPALPALRGRGYDRLPLIEGHRRYGATLHWMTAVVDAGPIVRVLSRALPPRLTHHDLRRRTQGLSLRLLEHTLAALRGSREVAELRAGLQRIAATPGNDRASWSGRCVSEAELQRLLRRLERQAPGHPALH